MINLIMIEKGLNIIQSDDEDPSNQSIVFIQLSKLSWFIDEMLNFTRSYYKGKDSEILKLIFSIIEQIFDVTYFDLKGKSRETKFKYPRHICFTLIRNHTSLSLSEIGQLLERDHSTVIHSIRHVSDMLFVNDPKEIILKYYACKTLLRNTLKPIDERNNGKLES